ncbi:cytochrome ubiquinol oxidase subunit I [Arcanobacterium hippocoleae]|uniref:Cytochrome d ubiquinol oxidase subunit I n=1 Tax=Arcanobacterium hippocoleae TaxID=149017 RepID=A0ABU1T417_9ACTO|nr:cytochrome ubiquinol oxidase subunit I [Arcanobacterium hippocoleae]MDR6940135.1 cytochrome d ubiquinol oxidase subunit I [Arcanobacterium hippocoleae]
MEALDLARWQFAITTVYHFILVPLTIGLSPLVAIMQTKWLRSGDKRWLKLSEFFGKLLLINFALGVATGIVQEFQFGMNWSEYSRFVGDIFGAPLAFEALLAFFLESTFLGVWIFGRGRISPKMHTAAIWLFALGTNISALFILAANSFMQNPVGAKLNPATGRAELDGATGFLQVIFSPTSMYAFAHTISASLLVAGSFIAGISLWWLVRTAKKGDGTEARDLWKPAANFGLVTMLIASILVLTTGHFMGQHIYKEQPTKMIAAMGIAKSQEAAPLAILMTSNELNEESIISLPIPGLESLMVTNHLSGKESKVLGADEVNKIYQSYFADVYGPNQNYLPSPLISFYSFRVMMVFGFASLALSILGLVLIRRKELPSAKWIGTLFVWTIPFPYISSTFGWILTEMGRQPWVVYPNFQAQPMDQTAPTEVIAQLTEAGVSQTVNSIEIIISLVAFTLIYAILGVIWYILIKRYAIEGINPAKQIDTEVRKEITIDTKLSFAY